MSEFVLYKNDLLLRYFFSTLNLNKEVIHFDGKDEINGNDHMFI
jgi:hypothetical protein